MAKEFDRKLVFEDGSEYYGYAFGAAGTKVCEAMFNTSPVGYQEIVTDPTYTDQLVVMTYPVIGNCGICDEDDETKIPNLGALAVRDYNDIPSNFRSTRTLAGVMEEFGIPGICGIDTRKLVRSIRDHGSRLCCICDATVKTEDAIEMIRSTPVRTDAVKRVSTCAKRYSKTAHHKYNVVAVDCGVRLTTMKTLNRCGCNVTVVPYDSAAEEIFSMRPDGVLFTDGPGDPADVPETVSLLKSLLGKVPVFGEGLGHQLLALAYGAKTAKMKFGHRGGNYPVRDVATGKIEITSQNHSYIVDKESLQNSPLTVTQVNVIDGTVEGMECAEDKAFSVQYHPNTAAYEKFTQLMEEYRNA